MGMTEILMIIGAVVAFGMLTSFGPTSQQGGSIMGIKTEKIVGAIAVIIIVLILMKNIAGLY